MSIEEKSASQGSIWGQSLGDPKRILGENMSVGKVCAAMALGILLTSTGVKAGSLGIAGEYNMFVLGDVGEWKSNGNQVNKSYKSDTEGRVAVGGNAAFQNYAIAHRSDSLSDNPDNQDALVVGGNLYYKNGSVGHNGVGQVHVGGEYINRNDNPWIIPESQLNLSSSPIDFAKEADYLTGLSSHLGDLATTGEVKSSWGTLGFIGSGAQLEVFDVSLQQMYSSHTFGLGNVADDATIVINVYGDNANGNWGGGTPGSFMIQDMSDWSIDWYSNAFTRANADRILYNFVDATSLSMSGVEIRGSILAPNTTVDFKNGQMYGNLIAGSLTGSGEMHRAGFSGYFDYESPSIPIPGDDVSGGGSNGGGAMVPEPASMLLLLAGYAGLKYAKRARA